MGSETIMGTKRIRKLSLAGFSRSSPVLQRARVHPAANISALLQLTLRLLELQLIARVATQLTQPEAPVQREGLGMPTQ